MSDVDNRRRFRGDLTLHNLRTQTSNPVRVRLVQRPGAFYTGTGTPPPLPKEVPGPVFDPGVSLAAGGSIKQHIEGECFAPDTNTNGYYQWWWVYALLEEQVDDSWIQRDAWLVLGAELPPEPNLSNTSTYVPAGQIDRYAPFIVTGGVTATGTGVSMPAFAPASTVTLSTATVTGPAEVYEFYDAKFSAQAVRSDLTTSSASPVWSSNPSSISGNGVVSPRGLTGDVAVIVNARFSENGVSVTGKRRVILRHLVPPQIEPLSEQKVFVGRPVELQLQADTRVDSYTASGLEELGLRLDQRTGIITGVPNAEFSVAIEVKATNRAGTGSPSSIVITAAKPGVLTVSSSQGGTVAKGFKGITLRNVGDVYVIEATPRRGYAFKGWSGGLNANSPSLAFTMPLELELFAEFVKDPLQSIRGSYCGILSRAGTPEGMVTIAVGGGGAVTSKLDFGNRSLQGKGFVSVSGTGMLKLQSGRSPSVDMAVAVDVNAPEPTISGELNEDGASMQFTAERAGAFSERSPTPLSGAGTILFESPNVKDIGSGFASASISTNGRVSLRGALENGVPIVTKARLSMRGAFPFLARKGSSFLVGEIQGNSGSGIALFDGNLSWSPDGTTRMASSAHGAAISVGSFPIRKARLTLDAPSGEESFSLDFSSQGRGGSVDNRVFLTQTRTGLFKGKFVPKDGAKAWPFEGVVVQPHGGGGWLRTPDGITKVVFEPLD